MHREVITQNDEVIPHQVMRSHLAVLSDTCALNAGDREKFRCTRLILALGHAKVRGILRLDCLRTVPGHL